MTDSSRQRYQLLITEGAKADLRACRDDDRYAAAKVAELLRLISEDRLAIEALVDGRYSDDKIHDVSPIWSLQKKRINAYRVRMVLISAWRIITAVDHKDQRIAILAIMPRDDNYEDNKALWARLEQEYDAIGFARY